MGTYVETLEIRGDESGAESALDKISQKVSTTSADWAKKLTAAGSKLDKTGKSMVSFGKTATTHVTLPLLAAAAGATKLAMDANETENKVRVVFGKMADSVIDWSDTSLDKMGLAKQGAQDMVSQFGLLFQAAGLGQKDVVGLSESFSQLTGDMVSFYNVPFDQALADLRSGLVGETEPLRKYGVFLSEANIQAEAMRIGLVKGAKGSQEAKAAQLDLIEAQKKYALSVQENGKNSIESKQALMDVKEANDAVKEAVSGSNVQLTEQQKLQARASLITTSLSKANGDYARTSESAANKGRHTWQSLLEAGAEIGQDLIPVFEDLLGVAQGAIDFFTGLDDGTRKLILTIAGLAAALGPLTMAFGGLLQVMGKGMKGGAWLLDFFAKMGGYTAPAAAGAQQAAGAVDALGTSAGKTAGTASKLGATLKGLGTGLAFAGMVYGLSKAYEYFDGVMNGNQATIDSWIGKIESGESSLSDLQAQTEATVAAADAKGNQAMASGAPITAMIEYNAGTRAINEYAAVQEHVAETTMAAAKATAQEKAELEELMGLDPSQLKGAFDLDIADTTADLQGLSDVDMSWMEDLSGTLGKLPAEQQAAGQAVAQLTGQYARMKGSLAGIDKEYVDYLMSTGQVAKAQAYMQQKVNQASAAYAKQVGALLRTKSAQQQYGSMLTKNSQLTKQQTSTLAKQLSAFDKAGGVMTEHQKHMLEAAVAAGDFQKAQEILNAALKKMPPRVQSKVMVTGTEQAFAQVSDIARELSAMNGNSYQANLKVVTSKSGMASGGVLPYGYAKGAVFGAAAGIVRQPTILTGEGKSVTPFGRGAEGVLPFDDRGITILAKAMGMAMDRRGGGAGQFIFTGNTIVGGPEADAWFKRMAERYFAGNLGA